MAEQPKDLERILEERLRLDSLLHEQFSRSITVLFTDIKGSTSFFETKGDLAGRTMIHQHNALVIPLIEANRGTLLKTIGDATMSVYEEPADGVRASVQIMQRLKEYNRGKPEREQIHVRAGLNFGTGIVEQNDVYGDLVNVASRVEAQAGAGDIFVTEELYRAVKHTDEFIFRFVNALPLKGKSENVSIYRVVWQQEDLQLGRVRGVADKSQRRERVFVIEASLRNETLKIGAYEKNVGAERPVRNYREMPYDSAGMGATIDGILGLLNQASRKGKIDNSLLVQLKEHGTTLAAALLPEEVRRQLADTDERHLLLSIDEALVEIPWELIFDGAGFLSQRFSIGRSVKTRATVSPVSRAVSRPLKMLVLADPRGDLPASRREGMVIAEEAEQVAEWLDVTLRDSAVTTGYVRDKIRNFDIVHYAGHAELDPRQSAANGWLLQDGLLTAEEIAGATGPLPMPALVFSNACQTGDWQLQGDYEHRVFGLANSFLLAGVQHYIGTFWEIPDEPGAVFASSFYGHLARGEAVGEALRLARQALIARYGEDTIVWAGYLLYGDPTTRYIDQTEERSTEEPAPVPPDLQQFQEMAQLAMARNRADARSKLPWGMAAGVLLVIALGAAYLLGQREQPVAAPTQAPVAQAQAPAPASGKELDELITSLAASYRSGTLPPARKDDGWSTPPLTLVFMDVTGPGTGTVDQVLNRLGQQLQTAAGVPLVERQVLLKLLQELKLASSSLADPATALKLGRILSARLMVTGSITPDGAGLTLALRFVDTETSAIRKVLTARLNTVDDSDGINAISQEIAGWLREEFPVRGTVQTVAGSQCRVNLGKGHGLHKGSRLELVQEASKGSGIYAVMGELQVQEVDKDSAVAALAGQGSVKQGDRVRMKL